MLLSRRWTSWSDALIIVKPGTVIKWHRAGFRRYWTWPRRPKGGRPAIDPEIRALIKRMATSNLWGAPRIHGELLKLGINVSEATVSKYLPRRRKPPSQTWRAFLENHVDTLVSVDFFTVPTVCFQVRFVFVVLAHALSALSSAAATVGTPRGGGLPRSAIEPVTPLKGSLRTGRRSQLVALGDSYTRSSRILRCECGLGGYRR